MHDFFETDPDKMYYDILAEKVRFIKYSDLEVKKLSGIMEKMREDGRKEGLAEGLAEGHAKGRAEERAERERSFVSNLLKDTRLAFDSIAKYAEVSIKFVQDMAKSLGVEPR